MPDNATYTDQEMLAHYMQPDNSLHGTFIGRGYVSWQKHRNRIIIDGDFTARELEAIAAHMTEHFDPNSVEPDAR